MAAPSTSVLDDFNAADTDPLNGNGIWASGNLHDWTSQTCQRLSNKVAKSGGADHGSCYTTATYSRASADVEVYMTGWASGGVGNNEMTVVIAMGGSLGTSSHDYYALRLNEGGSAWSLRRTDNGSETTLDSGTQGLSDGDGLWMHLASGGDITPYYYNGSTWSALSTASNDTTYNSGSLGIWFYKQDSADNFGGGEVSTAITSTIASSLAPAASSLSAGQEYPTTVASTVAALSGALQALMQPEGQIASTTAPLSDALTASHGIPSTIASSLAPLEDVVQTAQSYPVSIASVLAAASDALTAFMQPDGTIASTTAPASSALTAEQPFETTVTSLLVALLDALTASQGAYTTTVASALAALEDVLSAVMVPEATIASVLNAVEDSLTASQILAATIAALLAAIEDSLSAEHSQTASIDSDLAPLEDALTVTHGAFQTTLGSELAAISSQLQAGMQPDAAVAAVVAALVFAGESRFVERFFGGTRVGRALREAAMQAIDVAPMRALDDGQGAPQPLDTAPMRPIDEGPGMRPL